MPAPSEGIRRNNVLTGNTAGGEIPTVVTVEPTREPVEETEPEAEAATPKPKKTKKAPEVPAGR